MQPNVAKTSAANLWKILKTHHFTAFFLRINHVCVGGKMVARAESRYTIGTALYVNDVGQWRFSSTLSFEFYYQFLSFPLSSALREIFIKGKYTCRTFNFQCDRSKSTKAK